MESSRRHGFAAPPRIVFPALILIVLAMFLVFATVDSQNISAARILGTVVVGALILILFAIMAILARGRTRREPEKAT